MSQVGSILGEFGMHVEYVDAEGRVLHNARLQPVDFHAAVRQTQFDAFRRGLLDSYRPLAHGARIEPLFPVGHSASPRTSGFRVTIDLPAGREHACDFGISYFGSSATRTRAQLVRTKTMADDAELYYRLNAFLDDEPSERPGNKLALSLAPVVEGVPVGAGCARDYGPTAAWDDPHAEDLPVLVDHGVLDEVVAEARADPQRETAGFLLGHLHRDAQTSDLFLVVTGLASAGGTTQSSETAVTYTPASFVQGRAMARLRGAGESICGWYHSHPFKLCTNCPTPVRPTCIDQILTYSLDDHHLMETTFDQPYMVGLLAAVESRIEAAIGHLPVKLYGWRNGEIEPRGFQTFGLPAD